MLGQQAEVQKEEVGVRGMYRINIMEDGKLVGDSDWVENQVTNLGFNWYLAALLGNTTGSLQVGFMALGTGGAPGAADTSLAGEVEVRTSVGAATSSGSKTVRFTATFGSSDNFVTKTENISNVGLFALSAAGSIFAGNTYASSSCAVNQDVVIGVPCWQQHVKNRPNSGDTSLRETIPSQARGPIGLWACVENRRSAPAIAG